MEKILSVLGAIGFFLAVLCIFIATLGLGAVMLDIILEGVSKS